MVDNDVVDQKTKASRGEVTVDMAGTGRRDRARTPSISEACFCTNILTLGGRVPSIQHKTRSRSKEAGYI